MRTNKKHWETIRSDWEQFTVILHVKISSTWITSFPPKFRMNWLVFSVVEPLENPMRQKDEQSHAGWVTRTILQFEVFLLLIAHKDFYDIIKNTSLPIDWLTSEVEYNLAINSLGTETDVTRVKLRFMQKKTASKRTHSLTHVHIEWAVKHEQNNEFYHLWHMHLNETPSKNAAAMLPIVQCRCFMHEISTIWVKLKYEYDHMVWPMPAYFPFISSLTAYLLRCLFCLPVRAPD